jgi:glutathione S-transferase
MHALDPVRYTSLITLLAIAVYFYSGLLVGRARGTYGVKAPATTGHPQFERLFRGQMNTLEWLPMFLPALWLFALSVGDALAAVLGVVWIVGRLLYISSYAKAAEKRGPGFGVQAIAAFALWLGALIRVGMSVAGM